MVTASKLTRDLRLTVPKSVCEQAGLKEGDVVSFEVRDDEIVLKPQGPIDPDQAWFWTEEWQAGEREVDEELARGDVVGPFESMDEFMDYVDKRAAKLGTDKE